MIKFFVLLLISLPSLRGGTLVVLAAAAPETSGSAIAPDAIGGLSPKEVKGRWPSGFP